MSDPLIDAANAIAATSPAIKRFALLAAQRIIALEQTTQPPSTGPTWESATAWAREPITFTPTRTRTVSTPAQLTAALSDFRTGDLITATAFTFPTKLEVLAAPSGRAVLDLRRVLCAGYGPGAAELPAVFLNKTANLVVLLGDVTNPGGGEGVLCHAAHNCIVRVNRITNVGSDALGLISSEGDITDCDFYVADASQWGQVPSRDPHPEKGSGFHGAQISDSTYSVTNCRIAFYGHDGPTGACAQYGSTGGSTTGNRLAVKAERMTKVSTSQVAGNGLNLWGSKPISATVEYLEVNDAQGYAVSVDHEYGLDFSRVNVLYGRAHNTQQNPKWAAGPTFQAGPTYRDVKVV